MKAGKGKVEVCDDGRESKRLYGKGGIKGRLVLVILPLSQFLCACLINCEDARDDCSENGRWDE